MRCDDWTNYSELINLCKANPHLVEVYPNNQVRTADGQPAINSIRIKPPALKLLKEKLPRQVHRQTTVDGKRVDLRSERAHMIVTPPIENLIVTAPLWIHELQVETERGAWRAIRLKLERLLAYRGHELPLQLKDDIITALQNHTKPTSGNNELNADGGLESASESLPTY